MRFACFQLLELGDTEARLGQSEHGPGDRGEHRIRGALLEAHLVRVLDGECTQAAHRRLREQQDRLVRLRAHTERRRRRRDTDRQRVREAHGRRRLARPQPVSAELAGEWRRRLGHLHLGSEQSVGADDARHQAAAARRRQLGGVQQTSGAHHGLHLQWQVCRLGSAQEREHHQSQRSHVQGKCSRLFVIVCLVIHSCTCVSF